MSHLAAVLQLLPVVAGLSKPPDLSVLARRVSAFQSETALVQCVRLPECLISRQRLEFPFGPPVSEILSDVRNANIILAVVGTDQRRGKVLRHGVE